MSSTQTDTAGESALNASPLGRRGRLLTGSASSLCPLFRYHRAVYERNIAFLQGNAEKKTQANLMNVAMELRKVCNVRGQCQPLTRRFARGARILIRPVFIVFL